MHKNWYKKDNTSMKRKKTYRELYELNASAQQQLRWATVATIDMGRKEGGGCCPPFAGELDPHLTQCGLGRGLLQYQVTS